MGLLDGTDDQAITRERGRNDQARNDRVRNTQEAAPKDTYYRQEYGWVMSDADVATEQGVEAQYDQRAEGVSGAIAGADADALTEIDNGRGQISGAYDTAIADLTNVRPWTAPETTTASYTLSPPSNGGFSGGGNNEGGDIYGNIGTEALIEPATVNMTSGGIAQLNQALIDNGMAVTDEDGLIVSINDQGAELVTAYQTEYDTSIQNAQRQNTENERLRAIQLANFQDERTAAIDTYNSNSQTSLDAARNTWGAELDSLGTYADRVAQGKSDYETSKQRYSDSVVGIDAGLLERPTLQF